MWLCFCGSFFLARSCCTRSIYTYAGNDPLDNVDPEGQACSSLNTGSIYYLRRDTYVAYDRAAAQQTRFFGAAALTVEYLADNDIPGSSILGPSAQAQGFLKQVSASLYSQNAAALSGIMARRLSGPGLDNRMISMEQTRFQSMLDALPDDSRTAIVGSINSAFASRVAAFASGINSSDRAYNAVLSGWRRAWVEQSMSVSNVIVKQLEKLLSESRGRAVRALLRDRGSRRANLSCCNCLLFF